MVDPLRMQKRREEQQNTAIYTPPRQRVATEIFLEDRSFLSQDIGPYRTSRRQRQMEAIDPERRCLEMIARGHLGMTMGRTIVDVPSATG